MSKSKQISLFWKLFFLFSLLLIVTLSLLGFSFRRTFGFEIHRISTEIARTQAQSIVTDIVPHLKEPDFLQDYFRKAELRYHAHLIMYYADGTVNLTTDPAYAKKLNMSLQRLKKGLERPFQRIFHGIVIPVTESNQTIGYLYYETKKQLEHEVYRKFFSLMIFTTIVVLLVLYFMTRTLTKPLATLTNSVERIRRGDWDHRASVIGAREFSALAAQFNAMTERVLDLLSSQKELLAGISHELRSPLARINLALQMLHDRASSERTKELAENISGEINRMDEMIGELLEVSRLELDTEILKLGPVNLDEFVREVITEFQARWQTVESKKNLQNMRVTADKEQLTVSIDRKQIQRVIDNLLENARRYSPIEENIEIHCLKEGDFACLTVRDFGPGLHAGDLKKIFLPFFRAHQFEQHNTQVKGVGLGLYTASLMVQRHGGSLEAQNADPPPGLVVILKLPLLRPID